MQMCTVIHGEKGISRRAPRYAVKYIDNDVIAICCNIFLFNPFIKRINRGKYYIFPFLKGEGGL